jgi:hypothetical protein
VAIGPVVTGGTAMLLTDQPTSVWYIFGCLFYRSAPPLADGQLSVDNLLMQMMAMSRCCRSLPW